MSHGARLALLGALPLAILLLGLILLHGILLPFVVGMAAAYLLDPAADWLQRLHFSRTAATISITLGFFVFLREGPEGAGIQDAAAYTAYAATLGVLMVVTVWISAFV